MNVYLRNLILLLILLLSMAYCIYFFNGYLGLHDGNDYAGLARNIVRGEGFRLGHLYPLAYTFSHDMPQPNNLWAPAYPVYLAIWFYIFGANDTTILWATIFAIWLLILAVYLVARKLVGADWAVFAAALIGLNQSVLSTALEGSPEILTGALLLFAVLPLINKSGILRALISAVVFGLAVLARYQIIILALPILLFLFERNIRLKAIWVGMVALILSPWLVRNFILFGNPIFTLQAYGEFTKGMGHLKYYYYTYRSFTQMSLWYAVSNFPFYMLKKFVAGITFFSWWTMVVLNFFGIVPLIFAAMKNKIAGYSQSGFVKFALASLMLVIMVSSFNGIHLRHLVNVQGLLVITIVIGLILLKNQIQFFQKHWILAAILFLLVIPARLPFLEKELLANARTVEANKKVYERLSEISGPGDVIVSDASDAVWWYSDRFSIWIPVVYDDLKSLMKIQRIDYIYLEKTPDFLSRLEDEELVDFFTMASIVDGSEIGWSIYKVN